MELYEALKLISNKNTRNILIYMSEVEENEFHYEDITQGLVERGILDDNRDREAFDVQLKNRYLPEIDHYTQIDVDQESKKVNYNASNLLENVLEYTKKYE